ncbi:MAG: hypothetical protein ACUVXJ_05185 [Phycisphaerae bacterium]
MPDLELAFPTPDVPPDWSTINWNVHCPLCEYNLRGLNVPRCPECGYRFTWSEVLDPNRREHPYLFEHHPRRNFWSFRKTVGGAMRPQRFWTSLHPAMPSRPGRMLAYWLATFLCFAAVAATVLFLRSACELACSLIEGQTASLSFSFRGWRGRSTGLAAGFTRLPSAVWDFLLSLTGQCEQAEMLLSMAVLVLFAWPLLTLVSLKVFRWSMRRAKVNKVHVARCVLYSFDMIPPALTMLLVLLLLIGQAISDSDTGWHEPFLLFLPFLSVMFCIRRLYYAYVRYLRFDRPFLTVLASQIMVLLAIMVFWLPRLVEVRREIRSDWLNLCIRVIFSL